MKSITTEELTKCADDFTDVRVRVCIQSLARMLENDTFHAEPQAEGTSRSIQDVAEMFHVTYAQLRDLAEEMEIITTEDGLVVGANLVAQARGLAFDMGWEVCLTPKGQNLLSRALREAKC